MMLFSEISAASKAYTDDYQFVIGVRHAHVAIECAVVLRRHLQNACGHTTCKVRLNKSRHHHGNHKHKSDGSVHAPSANVLFCRFCKAGSHCEQPRVHTEVAVSNLHWSLHAIVTLLDFLAYSTV